MLFIDEPEHVAKCLLSKVQRRIYVCSVAGVLLAENGPCHIHGEEDCVVMYVNYWEAVEAVAKGF